MICFSNLFLSSHFSSPASSFLCLTSSASETRLCFYFLFFFAKSGSRLKHLPHPPQPLQQLPHFLGSPTSPSALLGLCGDQLSILPPPLHLAPPLLHQASVTVECCYGNRQSVGPGDTILCRNWQEETLSSICRG